MKSKPLWLRGGRKLREVIHQTILRGWLCSLQDSSPAPTNTHSKENNQIANPKFHGQHGQQNQLTRYPYKSPKQVGSDEPPTTRDHGIDICVGTTRRKERGRI